VTVVEEASGKNVLMLAVERLPCDEVRAHSSTSVGCRCLMPLPGVDSHRRFAFLGAARACACQVKQVVAQLPPHQLPQLPPLHPLANRRR
jgi:hypothetical protein